MKKYIIRKINIFILLPALLCGGCLNLDENPISLLAPESYFSTEDDVQRAVFGAYKYIANPNFWGRQYNTCLALLDDIHDIGDPGTNIERRQVNNHTMDGANAMIAAFWPVIYQASTAASAAINGLTKFTPTNQTRAKELEAEARMIRAFCYYHLVQMFGDVPYIANYGSDPWSMANITRTPASEVYEYIIEDCLFAEQNLPNTYENGVIRCRPTKGAAKTMLACIYLNLGDYQKAAQYAVDVINNRATYGYDLMEDYTDIWRLNPVGDVKETVWSIDFYGGSDDDLWGCMTGARGTSMFSKPSGVGLGGWSVVVPSPGYYGMFEPGDHRMESTFLLEATAPAPDNDKIIPYTEFTPTYAQRIHFGKYQWAGPQADLEGRYSGRNYAFYRFAEVYLIAAEALAEVNNGPTPEALGYLNKIRERARYGGAVPADYPSGMNKNDFINAVLKERMLEFGGEFKRWWDIKRRNLGAEAFGPNSIEPNPQRETANPIYGPTKKYLLPIFASEISKNPNLTQNQGY